MKWRTIRRNYASKDILFFPPQLERGEVWDVLNNRCPGWDVIIDTGTPRTIVPLSAAAFLRINVATVPTVDLTLPDNSTLSCPALFVKLFHTDFGTVGPVKAAFMNRDNVLLGRDCLCRLLLTYDGEKERFLIRKRKILDKFFLKCLALRKHPR